MLLLPTVSLLFVSNGKAIFLTDFCCCCFIWFFFIAVYMLGYAELNRDQATLWSDFATFYLCERTKGGGREQGVEGGGNQDLEGLSFPRRHWRGPLFSSSQEPPLARAACHHAPTTETESPQTQHPLPPLAMLAAGAFKLLHGLCDCSGEAL